MIRALSDWATQKFQPISLRNSITAIIVIGLAGTLWISQAVVTELNKQRDIGFEAWKVGSSIAEIYNSEHSAKEANHQQWNVPLKSGGTLHVGIRSAKTDLKRQGDNWLSSTIHVHKDQISDNTRSLQFKVSLQGATFGVRPLGPDEQNTLSDVFATMFAHVASRQASAIVSIKLDDDRWMDLTSETLWGPKWTLVQIGIAAIAALITLFLVLRLGAELLSAPFRNSAQYGHRLMRSAQADTISVRGTSDARSVAHALNSINLELHKQIENRTRFLVAISHDLRTPATRMRLRAETINDDMLRNKMLSDLDEMTGMVASAIEFLRGELEGAPEEMVMFTSLIESICDDYVDVGKQVTLSKAEPVTFEESRTIFNPTVNTVEVSTPRAILLQCEPSSLRRAFNNIIDNALKYGDWAQVSVDANSDFVLVEIMDGGPGIPKEETSNVFEPFYRVDSSRSRGTGGVGLGLTVAQSIIERHNGTINFHNHHEYGLVVRIELPRAA